MGSARGVLAGLLPRGVVSVETADDLAADLFPAEEAALGRAVEKRRREFVTGRACARRALTELGLPPTAVGSGPRGEPLWPPGVVGSITHCAGYRACAVARRAEVVALGIDAERNAALDPEVWRAVARPSERPLREVVANAHLDAVVFSAKEAVYKAWYPLTRRALDFTDAAVSIDVGRGTFDAERHVSGPVELMHVAGRWGVGDGVVVTVVAVVV